VTLKRQETDIPQPHWDPRIVHLDGPASPTRDTETTRLYTMRVGGTYVKWGAKNVLRMKLTLKSFFSTHTATLTFNKLKSSPKGTFALRVMLTGIVRSGPAHRIEPHFVLTGELEQNRQPGGPFQGPFQMSAQIPAEESKFFARNIARISVEWSTHMNASDASTTFHGLQLEG
jgi:hypothetical protein